MMKRPFVASYLNDKKNLVWKRHYARIETILRKAVEVLVLEGSPGDAIEIAHSDFGFQVAVVKIHAGGKINIDFSALLEKSPSRGKNSQQVKHSQTNRVTA